MRRFYMKKITIVIPYLNEPDNEVYKTVKSIYETADPIFNIITIDDGSEQKFKVDLSEFKDVRQIINKERIGVDGCRQMGGELSQTENLLILDSHMRFKKDNWINKMVESCDAEPDTIWCSTSLGLGYDTKMDLNRHKGKYYASDILFYNKESSKNRPSTECLECKWKKKGEGLIYEVPCVLGAVYFMKKKRFDYVKGFKGLKMWGSSEIFLSLKNWLAGGLSKIHTGIEVGHLYREAAPYRTGIKYLIYNKKYICDTILPEEIGEKVMNCLPKDKNFNSAMKLIEENKQVIESEKQHYKSIFTRSVYDFCKQYNLHV